MSRLKLMKVHIQPVPRRKSSLTSVTAFQLASPYLYTPFCLRYIEALKTMCNNKSGGNSKWGPNKLFLIKLVSVFIMEMMTSCSRQEAEGRILLLLELSHLALLVFSLSLSFPLLTPLKNNNCDRVWGGGGDGGYPPISTSPF